MANHLVAFRHIAAVPCLSVGEEPGARNQIDGGGPISVSDLVSRWRRGEEQAAEKLFDRYARKLTRLAEHHLSRKLAQRVEGEDIIQSVFRTFFARSAGGEFHIRNSVEIWRLLVKITLTKIREKARHHTAAKRDVNVEGQLDDDDWFVEAVASGPGPAEAVALTDEIEKLLKGLPESYCHVLTLRLEGYSRTQIAEELGVSRQTIYRVLGLLQQRLVCGE